MEHFKKHKVFYGYLKRYTLVHVAVYLVVGLTLMNLMNYSESFMKEEYFAHFRPLDSPIVRAGILFQFIRGAMIALILYPFRETIVNSKLGWLMLFSVLFGLTCLGAINATPGSIEGFIYTEVSLEAHLTGMPEVIIQSMGISVLFWWWERRKGRVTKQEFTVEEH